MKRSRPASARALVACGLLLAALAGCSDAPQSPATRPNVLWIVADDMGFEIGAYGDPLARTPNIDRLAAEGVRFSNAFATAGVCAPSRAALITGSYATTIGAHHMRSIVGGYQPVPPPDVKTFTEPLRAAGYFTSSLNKLDYQFSDGFDGAPRTNWDQPNGTYRERAPGQPFFAYVTLLDTHESQLFGDAATETDPAAVTVPPYLPDTPVVRRDLARHHDDVARLDAKVGELLARLDEDGLADQTVVVFLADNGRGLPREKRTVYDGGIHLPLIVRWPGHVAPGSVRDDLVSWIDLAPTVLALAGVARPAYLQGRVFLGDATEPEPEFVFAAADRHDEATDRIRAVRDRRYKYIRNHMPEQPYGQEIQFRELLGTMQEIRRLHDAGLLAPPADWFFRAPPKPLEELYDTAADPYEIENLAARPEHRERLARMRAAHDAWVAGSGDLGEIPEPVLAERYWPGGVQPVTPPPSLSPAGGDFARPVEVTITSDVAGASIAYTLDDGDDARWLLYSEPIVIGSDATLRAIAVRYGWAESTPAAATFALAAP
jgi:N-sulfoglucosamine sulfohydrolase